MRRQAKRAAELIATAAVLALAAAAWLAPGPRLPAEADAPAMAPTAAQGAAAGAALPEAAAPEQIAGLFGWAAPAPRAAQSRAPAAAVPPAPADWLAYVGFVAEADGGERFLFKDRRTGNVVPVSAASQWRLVEARPGELIAEHEGRLYVLKRGK